MLDLIKEIEIEGCRRKGGGIINKNVGEWQMYVEKNSQ